MTLSVRVDPNKTLEPNTFNLSLEMFVLLLRVALVLNNTSPKKIRYTS